MKLALWLSCLPALLRQRLWQSNTARTRAMAVPCHRGTPDLVSSTVMLIASDIRGGTSGIAPDI